jgi:hypothetical protein
MNIGGGGGETLLCVLSLLNLEYKIVFLFLERFFISGLDLDLTTTTDARRPTTDDAPKHSVVVLVARLEAQRVEGVDGQQRLAQQPVGFNNIRALHLQRGTGGLCPSNNIHSGYFGGILGTLPSIRKDDLGSCFFWGTLYVFRVMYFWVLCTYLGYFRRQHRSIGAYGFWVGSRAA